MLLLLLIFTVWFIAGYGIARYGLGVREAVMLPPLAFGIGSTLYAWLLNILMRVIDPRLTMWVGAICILLVAAGLWMWRRKQVKPLRISVSPLMMVLLPLLAIGVGIFFYQAGLYNATWDEFDHGPRATLISRVGLPVGNSLYPDTCLGYHYAVNMVTGSLLPYVGYQNIDSFDAALGAFYVVTALGLGFCFVWMMTNKKHAGWILLGCFLFATISQASWLPLLHKSAIFHELTKDMAFFDYSRALYPTTRYNALYVSAWHARPLIYSFTSLEEQAFWVVGFLALLAAYRLFRHPGKWFWYVGLGVLVAFTILYYSTAITLIAIPIGLALLYRVWTERNNPSLALRNLLLYTLTAFFFIIVQGGLVSSALFCQTTPEFNDTLGGEVFKFKLHLTPYYAIRSEPVELLKPKNWITILYDWGLPLILMPLTFVYYLYKKKVFASLLIGTTTALGMIPFFIYFEYTQENAARFATLSFWLTGLMVTPALAEFWNARLLKRFRLAKMMLIASLVFSLTFSSISNFYNSTFLRPIRGSLVMAELDYDAQADWLDRMDVQQDAVWDPSVFAGSISKGLGRSIMIFGTYSRIPFPYIWDHTHIIPDWDTTLMPGVLADMGFNYLYLDRESMGPFPPEHTCNLVNTQNYELLDKWYDGETGDYRLLFKIVGTTYENTPESLAYRQEQLALNADVNGVIWYENPDFYTPDYVEARSCQGEFYLFEGEPLDRTYDFIKWIQHVTLPQTPEQQLALDTWNTSRLPGDLKDAGAEYLLTSQPNRVFSSEFEKNVILPNGYELAETFAFHDRVYHLYQATGEQLYDLWGLSPDDYADYQVYRSPLELADDTLILEPGGEDLASMRNVMRIWGVYLTDEMSIDARHQLFTTLKILQHIVFPESLDDQQQDAVKNWHETFAPDDLPGIDFLLLEDSWLLQLDDRQREQLYDPALYQELSDYELHIDQETLYHLFRVLHDRPG